MTLWNFFVEPIVTVAWASVTSYSTVNKIWRYIRPPGSVSYQINAAFTVDTDVLTTATARGDDATSKNPDIIFSHTNRWEGFLIEDSPYHIPLYRPS